MGRKFDGNEKWFKAKYALGEEAGSYAIHGGGVPVCVKGSSKKKIIWLWSRVCRSLLGMLRRKGPNNDGLVMSSCKLFLERRWQKICSHETLDSIFRTLMSLEPFRRRTGWGI
jgi:hypothetical protein